MSYNGYGMDNDFGAYGAQHEASYLSNDYGAYGEALLTTVYKDNYREDTRQFQQLLKDAGFGELLGPKGVDGYFGDKTANATREYQASAGLPQTGTATQETWDALRQGRGRRGSGEGGKFTAGDIFSGVAKWFQPSGQSQPPWAANLLGQFGLGTQRQQMPQTPAPTEKKTPTWVIVTASVAGVAIVGGLIFALTRKKK